jgi:hypothetical protein
MKWLLKLIDLLVRLISRKKSAEKKMGDVPKDNYPMF